VQSTGWLKDSRLIEESDAFASSGCSDEGINGRQTDAVKRVSICISSARSGVNPSDLLVGLLSTTAFVETQVLHVVKVHDAKAVVSGSLDKSEGLKIDWMIVLEDS